MMETDYVTGQMAIAGASVIKDQYGKIADEALAVKVWVVMAQYLCAAMEGTTPSNVYPQQGDS